MLKSSLFKTHVSRVTTFLSTKPKLNEQA